VVKAPIELPKTFEIESSDVATQPRGEIVGQPAEHILATFDTGLPSQDWSYVGENCGGTALNWTHKG
jgi:hypothetical protein